MTVKSDQTKFPRSVKYNLQTSLFDINSQSKVYYLQEVEDERYQVFFGDGTFGRIAD